MYSRNRPPERVECDVEIDSNNSHVRSWNNVRGGVDLKVGSVKQNWMKIQYKKSSGERRVDGEKTRDGMERKMH